MKNPIHTFQTRLVIDEQTNSVLEKTAKLLSKVERCLFADIMSGKKISDLKSAYLNRFQITARQFNACRVNVEGLIDSRKKLQAQYIDELKQKIKSLEKGVKTKCAQKRFLKKRRLNKLKERLKRLETDKENGTVHICFGTKKLFRAQFHLEESNFQSIEEWKESWEEARSKAFFCLGSKDETSGNQTCRATIQDDGNITLRIRLPNILVSTYGPYITITDLHFKYGHNEIITSLRDCQYRNELQKLKKPLYKEHGQAISYRFLKDAKGWPLFVSTALFEPEWKTSSRSGLIGLDINTDHLAIVETDRYGNPISKRSIPLHLYGKDKKQSLAEIGPACAEAINIAKEVKKDLIIEELDFKRKKAELKEGSKYRRMLSSFAYSTIIQHLKSRAFRCGVYLHQVNPAFTSVLGRIKFAERYGLSVHQAAALCIARRFSKFSERPPRHLTNIPDGNGGHITLTVPVRNRLKHVWTHLGIINRKLLAVLAAHFKTAIYRSRGPLRRPLETFLDLDGETPSREPLATLLG